jgi:hypothetical protein
MTILKDWSLNLDVDAVLRGQGADPTILRARSPHLVETAARALEEGRPFLEPAVLYREIQVVSLLHERLILDDGHILSGSLIAQQLGSADKVVAIVCTIGEALEAYAAEVMASRMVYGLALDGVGSAAAEALAHAACHHFAGLVALEGLQTTVSLSPGMLGWSVEKGQQQLFSLLDASQIGVVLTPSYLMIPRKSLSLVIGVGAHVGVQGKPCDFCSMYDTCRYRSHDDVSS